MLKNSLKYFAIFVVLITAFSFKPAETFNLKNIKPFIGIWNNTTNPGTQMIIKSDGSFFTIVKEKDVRTITHSGFIKVLSGNIYAQVISYALPNSTYDLKGRQYAIQYTFNKDKQTLKQSGFVEGKNGLKGISWSEELIKTDHID